jgi:hypothetical protein
LLRRGQVTVAWWTSVANSSSTHCAGVPPLAGKVNPGECSPSGVTEARQDVPGKSALDVVAVTGAAQSVEHRTDVRLCGGAVGQIPELERGVADGEAFEIAYSRKVCSVPDEVVAVQVTVHDDGVRTRCREDTIDSIEQ